MGIASLVLGIIAIIIGIFGGVFIGWMGMILGIIGIILGSMAKRSATPENMGMAKAGFVLSIIGTIFSGIFYIACTALVSSMSFN